jgi:hypothetical protein
MPSGKTASKATTVITRIMARRERSLLREVTDYSR